MNLKIARVENIKSISDRKVWSATILIYKVMTL